MIGDDPLDPSAWKKFSKPVFRNTPRTCGVGHGSFVLSPDEKQWWHIYHAKIDREPGWRRALFAQPMRWYGGRPVFGQPIAAGKALEVASGTKFNPLTERLELDFTAETTQSLMDHYGHHQLIDWGDDGAAVGRDSDEVVNLFRCDEKLVLRDGNYEDVELVATFSFARGNRDVGVLFRTTFPAVGYDAQRGYFAGLIPGRGTVILGKTDGRHWHHIVDAKIEIDTSKTQTLRVRAVGDLIEVFAGDEQQAVITARDSDYQVGSVGVRVVDTFAVFHRLSVRPLEAAR